jgi:indolepyruvate ferredoxin oxidoreductase
VNEELLALRRVHVGQRMQVGLFEGARFDGVFRDVVRAMGPGPSTAAATSASTRTTAGSSRNGELCCLLAGERPRLQVLDRLPPHQKLSPRSTAAIESRCCIRRACRDGSIALGVHALRDVALFGLLGRFAVKVVSDNVDTSASIELDPARGENRLPTEFRHAEGACNSLAHRPMEQELRLQRDKVYAALAYCRVYGLNRITVDSPRRAWHHRLGQELPRRVAGIEDLGIDSKHAAEIGIRSSRSACPGRSSPTACAEFAQGWRRSSSSRRTPVIAYQ